MREKKLWLIITFHTTTAAMAMEAMCAAKDLPGRLIPVPREKLVSAAAEAGIAVDGTYELML